MKPCLIAIGCNQGDCQASFRKALQKIDELPQTHLVATSTMRETQPVGKLHGTFLNGALLVETGLQPPEFMQHLLRLESESGRNRSRDAGNRPLDLDILLFGQQVLQTPDLSVPHPRMSFRRFVLEPAVEIAPDMIHPQLGISLGDLLRRIQKERNIVVVLLPSDFDLQQLDLRPDGNVHWVNPKTQRELLASLREHVSVNQHWLVVFCHDRETLSHLKDAIKLLITVAERTENTDIQFNGPRWALNHVSVVDLQRHVLTAIQSMQAEGRKP